MFFPGFMHTPPGFEFRATAISIQLISNQDPRTIGILKNLLSYIPSPRKVQEVLTAAIVQICDTSTETTCWLLQNPELLQPEVDVIDVITQHLSQKLLACGLIVGQDFQFTAAGKLLMPEFHRQSFLKCYASSLNIVTLAIIRVLIEPQPAAM